MQIRTIALAAGVLTLILALASPVSAEGLAFQPIGHLQGGMPHCEAFDVSADGSVMVGYSSSGPGTFQSFRWTPTAGMLGLGTMSPQDRDNRAVAVTPDGSVIVGYGTFGSSEAFRWTQAGGLVGLGGSNSRAYDVSDDGSVVVGSRAAGADLVAFRWTAATGLTSLGYLPHLPEWSPISSAHGVSADGSVVVGNSTSYSGQQAFRWTASGGMVGLGDLPGGELGSGATAVSADGSVVVGYGRSASGTEAFRWTAAGGMVGLGDLPGGPFNSAATGVSADGSIVIGRSQTDLGWEAFIWDAEHGIRNLKSVLIAGGADLSGWILSTVGRISADGSTIVGSGVNAEDQTEAWRATIPPATPTHTPVLPGLRIVLEPNHPNPFNPATQIGYSIPAAGRVELRVYAANGRSIRTLVSAVQPAGRHDATWDGRDDAGSGVPAGVYYLKLTSLGEVVARSMTLVK